MKRNCVNWNYWQTSIMNHSEELGRGLQRNGMLTEKGHAMTSVFAVVSRLVSFFKYAAQYQKEDELIKKKEGDTYR